MQTTQYILILLFSCFTGWVIIWFIQTILFRPEKPLSVAGFKLQGIFPKNQSQLAEQIADKLSRDVLSLEPLKEKAADPSNFQKLKPEIEFHVDHFLREKLKDSFPMLSMFIGDKTINQLKTAFMTELEGLFPVIMKSYLVNLEKDLDIRKLVLEKINDFSFRQSGALTSRPVKKLFTRLQLAGALTGLLLGLVEVLLLMLLG